VFRGKNSGLSFRPKRRNDDQAARSSGRTVRRSLDPHTQDQQSHEQYSETGEVRSWARRHRTAGRIAAGLLAVQLNRCADPIPSCTANTGGIPANPLPANRAHQHHYLHDQGSVALDLQSPGKQRVQGGERAAR